MAPTFIPTATLPPHPHTKRLADATKYTVSTAVALAVLHNRDARTLLYATGGLASSLTAKLLKRVIRQPRPTERKLDPGMPSSHATSLAYLSLAAWGGRCARLADIVPLLGVLAALVGSAARVRVGYHSWGQVIVGWLLGAVNAFVWLNTVAWFVEPVERWMNGFGDAAVMLVLTVVAGIIAAPDILAQLRKRR